MTVYIPPCKVRPLEGDLAWLQGPEFSGMGECERSYSRDRKTSGMGAGKKATARTSCCNILNATTPATKEPTTAEILAKAWVPARL